jgi:hypothetical protein
MAAWRSGELLQRHFDDHGRQMGCRTVEEYAASADETLASGSYFSYWDESSGEERVGCFDRHSCRFVALNDQDEIVTHFVATERYPRRLPYSNYDG